MLEKCHKVSISLPADVGEYLKKKEQDAAEQGFRFVPSHFFSELARKKMREDGFDPQG
jgi:hypothetical protein